jgi:O-antigen/teichoic acid export membrane protein
MWRYISSYLSAHHQFSRLALFLTTVPILMLAAALGLAIFGRLTLPAVIVIHLAAPTLAALIWLPALDREFLREPLRGDHRAGPILRFSRWVYLSNLASSNRNHLNPLLLKNPYFSGTLADGEVNAGLYGFGSDLANEVTVFSQSLLTVLLPRASRATTGPDLRRFVRRSYKHLLLLAVPAALPFFLARPFMLLLGMIRESYLEYLPSLSVFTILYAGALFSIAGIPMQTAVYSMKLPRVETYIEMALLVVLIAGAFLLIPRYGAEGAAFVVLVQRVLFFAILTIYGWSRLRRYEAGAA